MGFKRETIKDFYLLATDVENIFINEYMPVAPGDFVKVYLYGLLYSQNGSLGLLGFYGDCRKNTV